MKFIHSADWQIGMTFLGFKEKSRSAMEDDRIEVIEAKHALQISTVITNSLP